MELGVLIVLAASVMTSVREGIQKHLSSDYSSVKIGYIGEVYGLVILAPFAGYIFLTRNVVLTPKVFLTVLISALSIISTIYIYIEALRISDISVISPLKQTTPLLVAVLEPFVLGIVFNPVIVVAATLGTIGSYILVSENGYLKPLENIRNKGALMALLVAFIYSISSIAQRYGSTNIDPMIFTFLIYLVGLIGFWIWMKNEGEKVELETYFDREIIALGTVTTLGAVLTIYGFSLISASEATIIKQSSGIFSVLIGRQIFKEDSIYRKLLGAGIIILGVGLVIFLG